MSHAKLIVDGEVLLDDSLSTWSRADPGFIKSLVDPSVKPQLHMMAAGLVLSQATLLGKSVSITVNTQGPDKWTLDVETT